MQVLFLLCRVSQRLVEVDGMTVEWCHFAKN